MKVWPASQNKAVRCVLLDKLLLHAMIKLKTPIFVWLQLISASKHLTVKEFKASLQQLTSKLDECVFRTVKSLESNIFTVCHKEYLPHESQ